jgi:DNA-binding CsgD family transcriptional regulator
MGLYLGMLNKQTKLTVMKKTNSTPTTEVLDTPVVNQSTPSFKDQVKLLVEEGKSRREIANILQVDYSKVYFAIRNLNITDVKPSKNTNPHKDVIIQLRDSGKSCSEIAKELNLKYSEVYFTYIRR